jgi:hypothetical protein
MKYFAFLLLLLPLVSPAQITQEITLDTTYLVWINGLAYERHDVEWETGFNYYQNPEPIGDTTQVESYILNTAVNANQDLAGYAITFINKGPVVKQLFATFNTMYQSLTGTTLQVALANYFLETLLGNYRLSSNGTSLGNYELVQMPSGVLRLRLIGTPATFYVCVAKSANMIQLNNLDAGQNIDMFLVGKTGTGKPLYLSIDKKWRLVRL